MKKLKHKVISKVKLLDLSDYEDVGIDTGLKEGILYPIMKENKYGDVYVMSKIPSYYCQCTGWLFEKHEIERVSGLKLIRPKLKLKRK